MPERLNDSTEELQRILSRVRPHGSIARIIRRELELRNLDNQQWTIGMHVRADDGWSGIITATHGSLVRVTRTGDGDRVLSTSRLERLDDAK